MVPRIEYDLRTTVVAARRVCPRIAASEFAQQRCARQNSTFVSCIGQGARYLVLFELRLAECLRHFLGFQPAQAQGDRHVVHRVLGSPHFRCDLGRGHGDGFERTRDVGAIGPELLEARDDLCAQTAEPPALWGMFRLSGRERAREAYIGSWSGSSAPMKPTCWRAGADLLLRFRQPVPGWRPP